MQNTYYKNFRNIIYVLARLRYIGYCTLGLVDCGIIFGSTRSRKKENARGRVIDSFWFSSGGVLWIYFIEMYDTRYIRFSLLGELFFIHYFFFIFNFFNILF